MIRMSETTIAAISTPDASGGISIVRISGADAFSVADRIFVPSDKSKSAKTMAGFTCAYGKAVHNGSVIDDGILTIYRAPKSYTGENVAEISCHGGIFVTRELLRAALDSGAVLARGGEFTQRAFLNGKLTLTQAEAVMDIINVKNAAAQKSALALREGALYRKIKAVSDNITVLLGEISAWTDYPEEDIEAVSDEKLLDAIRGAKRTLNDVIGGYDNGKIFREGVDTVIVGKPNVGKSTIMNCLTGYERSIVTEIAGTTRDVVEETVNLGEFTLRLADTAGIRDTDDVVEAAGVERSYTKLERAQLVIAVFDNGEALSDEDIRLIDRLDDKKTVAVINKSDREAVLDRKIINDKFKYMAEISAVNGEGMDKLKQSVAGIFAVGKLDLTDGCAANERQRACACAALNSLDEAESAVLSGISLDATGIVLNEALSHLMELTGENVTEAVVEQVFSKFCVGK